jgi:hypothetical protein
MAMMGLGRCRLAPLYIIAVVASGGGSVVKGGGDCNGEVLPSGICLGVQWPPVTARSHTPMVPPYLTNPPSVIDVSTGRQLFVDSFLVDATHTVNLTTTFHGECTCTTWRHHHHVLRVYRGCVYRQRR